VNVVCLPDNTGSTLFASAQVSEYALKKSSSAASVGVSALGSISLPIGQSADSLVKVKEETIDDKDFYQRFFTAVGKTLVEMQAGKPVSRPAAETGEPELAPASAPKPLPAPAPEPSAVVAPASPAAPVALPAVAPELRPVPEAAATVVQEPLTEAPMPASRPEPLPGPPAPAGTPESTAQEIPAANPELLQENAGAVQVQTPSSDDEASGIPQEQATPQANTATASSPPPLSPVTPVTPVTAPEPEPAPKASQVNEEPTNIAPAPAPDPLIEELF
jgi:hypothetical protein